MKNRAAGAVLLAAVSAFSVNVAAEEAVATQWKGDLEFGYINKSGNTDSENLNFKLDLNREHDPWRNNVHFEASNSSEDNNRSGERYFFSTKHDYLLNEFDYLFGYASHEDDRYSGLDSRTTLVGGYGRRLLHEKDMELDVEAGAGYKVDNPMLGEVDGYAIIRLAGKYVWDISPTSRFQQDLSVEAGGGNTESKSETSLRTQINETLALKLSYSIKYNHHVPRGREHSDTETSITLVYGF